MAVLFLIAARPVAPEVPVTASVHRVELREGLEREEKDQRFNEWMMGLKKASTIEVNKDMAPVVGVVWEE